MTGAAVSTGLAVGLLAFAAADLIAARPVAGMRLPRIAGSLASLGRRMGTPVAPADLAARIAAAGLGDRVSAAEAMAVKVGAATAAALAAVLPATALPGRLGVAAMLAAPLAAFLGPDLWLRRRTRQRARQMEIELADVLELLIVCVEAGLTPLRSMAEIGRRHPSLLGAELGAVARHAALGVSQAEALDGLLARSPVPAMADLVAALRRADRHGAPLAVALAALARDARSRRARALRDRAARAAPQIQLVIALLLVPSVMLLVAAALLGTLTG